MAALFVIALRLEATQISFHKENYKQALRRSLTNVLLRKERTG